ncbi:hypothetical protein XacyCFBP2565_21975 [Xanthomonas arboricola pv. corylina]|uniref:hypothetical protein n=1 Tax=Xanthomonas arboricola TaxID=56448 RepID=UPI000CEE2741|nr:hypothetical protein [Xanthomonas arboricola]PPU05233.1 hypothetical protein XacyCFBP2565_21975 [Xanthomonas arboricola pv. corylina]
MAVTIKINDPQTIELLQSYSQFLSQVDGVGGTLDDVAEGIVFALLDEHMRFRQWRRGTCTEARAS